MEMIPISRALCAAVDGLRFGPPVVHVYNPLTYAREPHERYLERFGRAPRRFVLVGMNPGPFGMAQTGVPFGDVPSVRDWMGQPATWHEKRPVQGFEFARREGSGKRLWGWAAERFPSADAFFERFFVHNYCPLLFLHETGRNLTPDKLRTVETAALYEACDEALRQVVDALGAEVVIGVGRFAENRARMVLGDDGPEIARILHPSPASPAANRDWAGQVEPVLRKLGAL